MALEDTLQKVIASQPGLSAREIASELRRSYGLGLHKHDLNPILYRCTDIFVHDGGYVPRWHLVGQQTARSITSETTLSERAKILRLDQHRVISAAPSPVIPMVCAESIPVPSVIRAADSPPLQWELNLMPWQQEAMAGWYRAGRVGVIEAVTGTGKTHLGLEAVAQCVRVGQRATVLVPSLELMRQWRRRIAEFLPWVSVATLGGGITQDLRYASVVIANVNSALLEDLSSGINPPSLLVADEVHRYGSKEWRTALRARYCYRMGLTATLERSDDDGVESVIRPYFGSLLIMSYTYSRAVRESVVAPFDLIFLGVALNLEEGDAYEMYTGRICKAYSALIKHGVSDANFNREVHRLSGAAGPIGMYARMYESSARQRRNLLADCHGKLDAVARLAPLVAERQGTAIFTQRVPLAEACAHQLRELGVEALAVHGKVPSAERQDAIDRLADGSIAALVAPKILDEGIDVPNIDLGIVLGASRGRRQMIQRLGRVIRKKADGRAALFLVVYARETVEDPAQGAHEGFIGIVREAARSEEVHPSWTVDDILDRA